jgi:hypothetical protein
MAGLKQVKGTTCSVTEHHLLIRQCRGGMQAALCRLCRIMQLNVQDTMCRTKPSGCRILHCVQAKCTHRHIANNTVTLNTSLDDEVSRLQPL